MTSSSADTTPETTVLELYEALATGDVATLRRLLAEDFHADLTPGLPWGLGSRPYESAAAMMREACGRVFMELDLVPHPAEVHVVDTEVIVRGTYVGRSRLSGARLDAWFAHFWRTSNGRVVRLVQVTDTAAWIAAAETEPLPRDAETG